MLLIALIADGTTMASITIRNLDDNLKQHLWVRAAQHGRSMEDEARDILRLALAEEVTATAGSGFGHTSPLRAVRRRRAADRAA